MLQKSIEDVTYACSCDPATGKGDYSAIIVVARDNKTGTLYVIEADIRRSRLMKQLMISLLSLKNIIYPCLL